MTKIRSRHLAMIIAVAMLFAGGYVFGAQDAAAASKPKAPKTIRSSCGDDYAKISWSKVAKNVKGYTLYRDGKAIKSVGSSVTKYKDTGLNPETNYSYKVRAYNTVKKKHWYNKKTGK